MRILIKKYNNPVLYYHKPFTTINEKKWLIKKRVFEKNIEICLNVH